MNDITAIASTMMAMSQSQTQDQIGMSMIKMNAEAEQAVADMLMQNARQIEALSHAANKGILDLFA